MFNVFDDNGSHERGQTFGLVVGAEIQTNCNFEAHISHCRYSLDYNRCHYSIPHVTFSYSALVWSHYHLILPISLDYIICALRRYQAQIQDHVQHQPSQPNALNIGQYRKAVYSALWVQLALLPCYVPVSVVAIMMAHRQANLSH